MTDFNFQPITFKKLSELIESYLRVLILKGEIEPGERLPNERELGRQFKVSLVTVREALKGLETYGLIEKKKGRGGGVFVSELRSDAIKVLLFHFLHQKRFSSKDLSELRMILEPDASRIAARRISKAKLAELESNIEHCEAFMDKIGSDFSENDFFKLERSNIEFHRLIGEATENPVLILTIDYVLEFLFNFKRMTLVPNLQFSHGIVRDHRLIFTQLKERDGKAAEERMILHLQNVEEYLAEKEEEEETVEAARKEDETPGWVESDIRPPRARQKKR
jgi:GntR family transcriptional regulator, transcriptional repressor for pyruvate dehydrogenase complex